MRPVGARTFGLVAGACLAGVLATTPRMAWADPPKPFTVGSKSFTESVVLGTNFFLAWARISRCFMILATVFSQTLWPWATSARWTRGLP